MVAKAGVLVGDGPATTMDLTAIQQAQLEAVKMRAIVNPPSDVPRYRDIGVDTFLVQLLSPMPAQQPTSPQEFVSQFAPAVEAFVAVGVQDFEIHGEPNLASRGYGLSWGSPTAFGDWFEEVTELLRTQFGTAVRVGFPALTPPPPRWPTSTPAVSENDFLAAVSGAIRAADFICCHVYWTTADELRAVDGGMRFLRRYLETFPAKPLIISEFANLNPNTNSAVKGDQYAEFYFACTQYDQCEQNWPANPVHWPRLQAAYAFLLRSPDPTFAPQSWLDADGQPRSVVGRVGSRSRMPDPRALRLTWPTEFRFYTQYYGENQQSYFEHSFRRSLRGGHNGVDLHVNYHDPSSSPIRACLSGTVTRKEMRETGYGHHVYIESMVPGVGRVTLLYAHMSYIIVEQGQNVTAGQVIGAAGMTGATTGPHLHLSMKIEGLTFPANGNHLNARPYLDPPPAPPVRGLPRTQYQRVYVLLPPQADAAWARAVIDATWDAHRFTVGGSADDAGIGDLDARYVIAVNPPAWGDDLQAFFVAHYPGVAYHPVEADTPDTLRAALSDVDISDLVLPPQPDRERGRPRAPYERTYVLLPPDADARWAHAVAVATWNSYRFTIGGSADDAGIGDLDVRRVIAVNPSAWGGDLEVFFQTYYPGVAYEAVTAETPEALKTLLSQRA